MGSFDGKVWKQKRQKLTWFLRWALNARGSMTPKHWVMEKATQRYHQWRKSEDFRAMLQSVKLNTEWFWQQECPDMDPEELNEKVSIPRQSLTRWVFYRD